MQKEKDAMSVILYSFIVESLMYTKVCTWLDIAHVIEVVRKLLSNPSKDHWEAIKWFLRYLQCSSKMYLCVRIVEPIFEGYTKCRYSKWLRW